MEILVVKNEIPHAQVQKLAKESYGEMVKAVADIGQEIIAIGGEWHADAEALLLEEGSKQSDLWGFNIYPSRPREQWIEFVSLINIRPKQNNRKMEVEDIKIQGKISQIVNKLII